MISPMAIEDIEELQERGMKPTPADIVRLNALGLKCENNEDVTHYILPRVAFLGRSLSFREPTIGHAIWMSAVSRFCAEDLTTVTAVRAYALSRQLAALPDAADRDAVRLAIDNFTKTDLAPFTFAQIHAAVTYAIDGNDGIAHEYPPPRPDAPTFADDDCVSIGAGVMIETLAMGLGISIRDAQSLTKSQAERLQAIGLAKSGISRGDLNHKDAVANYLATLSEIKQRLKTNG